MGQGIEKIIKLVYRNWKKEQPATESAHPDEEMLVCFAEGRLSKEEWELVKGHLLTCDACSQALAFNLELKGTEVMDVPEEMVDRLKNLVSQVNKASCLEIILKLKEKALEIINTTGDVLMGQELIPAPILRSRQIREFKDEVNILKDFKDIRVEVKIENKGQNIFNVIIQVRQKNTQKPLKDLRVTLISGDTELESYLTDLGSVKFEHVLLGDYLVEISSAESKLASVILDIKA